MSSVSLQEPINEREGYRKSKSIILSTRMTKQTREGEGNESLIYRILPWRNERIKFINDYSFCYVALKEIVQITGNVV